MKNQIKISLKLLIFMGILLGIAIRLYFLKNHFTHCDDIGVAIMINAKSTLFGKFRSFTDWTYAPLQFTLLAPLISIAKSYYSTIILGRIPSFLFGVLNIFLAHYVLRKFISSSWAILLGDLLLALSWENIIYSAQMEPYVIAITFILLQVWLLHFWQNDVNTSLTKKCILTCIVAILSCYAQYQLFLFVFALFISLLLLKKVKLKKILPYGVFTILMNIPLIYLILRLLRAGFNTNWNVGIHREFIFDGSVNVFKFFVDNFACIVRYFFTSDIAIANIITIILLFLFFIGLLALNRNENLLIGIYFDIILFLYVALVFLGKLAFGPSRQNLVLFPIILISITIGANILCRFKLFTMKIGTILSLILSLCTIVSFVMVARDEIINRTNMVSEDFMAKCIEDYQPSKIISYGGEKYDFLILKFNGYEQNSKWLRYGLFTKNENNNNRIMIVGNVPLTDKVYEKEIVRRELFKRTDIFTEPITWKQLNVVYANEFTTDKQIDYASKYYNNTENGFCVYVVDVKKEIE